jgi:hypothetical protein
VSRRGVRFTPRSRSLMARTQPRPFGQFLLGHPTEHPVTPEQVPERLWLVCRLHGPILPSVPGSSRQGVRPKDVDIVWVRCGFFVVSSLLLTNTGDRANQKGERIVT